MSVVDSWQSGRARSLSPSMAHACQLMAMDAHACAMCVRGVALVMHQAPGYLISLESRFRLEEGRDRSLMVCPHARTHSHTCTHSSLPEDILVLDMKRVTKGFNAKNQAEVSLPLSPPQPLSPPLSPSLSRGGEGGGGGQSRHGRIGPRPKPQPPTPNLRVADISI
jgi:hypothetical protein